MFSSFKWVFVVACLSLSTIAFGGELVLSCHPNLGIVPVGTVAKFEVHVQNRSLVPLALVNVSSSCPCVTLSDSESFLEPGKSSSIQLEYKPERDGFSLVEIRLETDPPQTLPNPLQLALLAASEERLKQRIFDSEHSITTSELERLLQKGEVMLVDVRDPQDSAKGKIRDAIAIPLSLLDKFPISPKRQVVVYGGGLNDGEVIRAMKNSKAKILRGGIRSWERAGNSVAPQPRIQSAVIELQQLISSEYIWIPTVLVTNEHTREGTLPGSLLLASADDLGARLPALQPIDSPVLILTENGLGYSEIEERLPTNLHRPVFYLKGGLPEFLKIQALNFKDSRTVTVSSGVRDGQGNSISPGAAGCNTCPAKPDKPKSSSR